VCCRYALMCACRETYCTLDTCCTATPTVSTSATLLPPMFHTDSLLRRRPELATADMSFHRVLILALQNELTAARRLIEKYDLESNPDLKFLVEPPEIPPDFLSRKKVQEIHLKLRTLLLPSSLLLVLFG
jgi:hypothetical protein